MVKRDFFQNYSKEALASGGAKERPRVSFNDGKNNKFDIGNDNKGKHLRPVRKWSAGRDYKARPLKYLNHTNNVWLTVKQHKILQLILICPLAYTQIIGV